MGTKTSKRTPTVIERTPTISKRTPTIKHTVVLVGLTGMHKTGYSGEGRLVLHAPS